jgi:hypothetical protein
MGMLINTKELILFEIVSVTKLQYDQRYAGNFSTAQVSNDLKIYPCRLKTPELRI